MKHILMFTLGAAAGSLLTWKFVEKKYKQIADEEIEAVREVYRKRSGLTSEIVEPQLIKDGKEELTKQVQELNYIQKEEIKEDDLFTVQTEENEGVAPYIISPEEYGDVNGYDARSWTLYADGVVSDEDDNVIGNPENIIGDCLDRFGEYDNDAIFIRNENLKCDYEVLKHDKPYDETGSY